MFAWQATAQDDRGNVIPNPVVTVYMGDGETLAKIHDESGAEIANPHTGTSEGFIQFYVPGGQYKVIGKSGSDETQTWQIDAGGTEYATRPDFVAAVAGGLNYSSGTVVVADGIQYQAAPGATAIADIPGWVPVEKSVAAFNGDIAAANTYNPAEYTDYGGELWPNDQASSYFNVYGASNYRTAGKRIQVGTYSAPVDQTRPVVVVHKESSANRDSDPSAWDQSLYVSLSARTGDAYRAAITGFTRSWPGANDMDAIGVHGRTDIRNNTSRGYGGWFYYSEFLEGSNAVAGHAVEMNGNVRNDPGYGTKHQLLRLCMADSASEFNRFSSALTVGRTTLGGNNGFYTGIHFEYNSLIPTSGAAIVDGEAFRVDSPSSGSVGGLRFAKSVPEHTGSFRYALKTDESSFVNNEAVILGSGQRVSWFTDGARGVSLLGGSNNLILSSGYLNVSTPVGATNTAVQVSGVQVLSTRKTGWTATTGTISRGGWDSASVTLPNLAATVRGIIADLTSHGIIGT